VRNKCTRSVAKFNIAAIFAAVFALNAHFLYGLHLKDTVAAKQKSLCEFINDDYKYFFQSVWNWINLTVAFILPFGLLAVGNIVIVKELYQSRRLRRALVEAGRADTDKEHSARQIMVTLILLSSVFFISQTPMLYYIYLPYHQAATRSLDCHDYTRFLHETDVIWFWYTVTSLVSYTNATVNFLMYVASGERFRREIVGLLLCQGRRESPGRMGSAATMMTASGRIWASSTSRTHNGVLEGTA